MNLSGSLIVAWPRSYSASIQMVIWCLPSSKKVVLGYCPEPNVFNDQIGLFSNLSGGGLGQRFSEFQMSAAGQGPAAGTVGTLSLSHQEFTLMKYEHPQPSMREPLLGFLYLR